MKPTILLAGLLVLGFTLAGCNDHSPTAPASTSSTATFTAALLPSNQVQPVNGDEANGSAVATLTFNLTKDPRGNVIASSADVTVAAAGFPPGTTIMAAHVHSGAAGTNGGVFLDFELAAGDAVFANGSGSFTKRGLAMTVDQANAILANPAGFYANMHTAANPNGVARGQLTRVQ